MEQLLLIIVGTLIALFGLQYKNWLSSKKIDEVDRQLFKNQEAIGARLEALGNEAHLIPDKEASKTEQEALDEWNKK